MNPPHRRSPRRLVSAGGPTTGRTPKGEDA